MADPILFAGVGVGLSISLAAIGAGLGIGITGPGVAGATTEKPEVFARSFIAVVLAEALAIYGLVVALLAVFKLPAIATSTDPVAAGNSAFRIFAAGIAMGGGALGAGFGIGTTGSAMASATAEKSELYSRVVIPVILSEALAIYSLIIALLLVLQA
ncbi:MAG TPA: V-type ATP synthase subunit K [Candidatus Angelobacter sp.]|nr:V-type ATP synthase subunit K [Candidatus Angelobacter sp.]